MSFSTTENDCRDRHARPWTDCRPREPLEDTRSPREELKNLAGTGRTGDGPGA